MKFSTFCFLWTLLVSVQLTFAADKEISRSQQKGKNLTVAGGGGVGESRTIVKKFGCPNSSSSEGGTFGISDFFSSISSMISGWFSSDKFSSFTSNFTLPDINSISVNEDKFTLDKFKKFSVPFIFFISVIIGAIAAAITVIIPSYIQPDNMVENMLDTMYNFVQQAESDVSSQYGVPDQYGQQDSSSYGHHQQAYSQDPSSAYSVPSSSYSSPHRRYTSNNNNYAQPNSNNNAQQQYPSLSTNYLRSEKTKKK